MKTIAKNELKTIVAGGGWYLADWNGDGVFQWRCIDIVHNTECWSSRLGNYINGHGAQLL